MADEYISREAAFNAILKLVPKVDDDGYCWVIRGDAAKAIDSIPAADVAPRCPHYIRNVHDRGDDSLCEKWGCEVKEAAPVRHGRWTRHYVGQENIPWGSDCSVCGEWLVIDRTVMNEKYHYCPNCGARLDLEEDDGV